MSILTRLSRVIPEVQDFRRCSLKYVYHNSSFCLSRHKGCRVFISFETKTHRPYIIAPVAYSIIRKRQEALVALLNTAWLDLSLGRDLI